MNKKITYLFLIIFSCFLTTSYGQTRKSDLRKKVDSIIKHQIKYKIDTSSNNNSVNPYTMIILDEKVVDIDLLNLYKLAQVEVMNIFPKNHGVALTLYGPEAINGVVLIELKN